MKTENGTTTITSKAITSVHLGRCEGDCEHPLTRIAPLLPLLRRPKDDDDDDN